MINTDFPFIEEQSFAEVAELEPVTVDYFPEPIGFETAEAWPAERPRRADSAAIFLLAAVMFFLGLILSGCGAAPETKALVSTSAATADGNLREWGELTQEERKLAHWKLARSLHVLDLGVNGVPLAPEWISAEPPK